MIRTLFRPLAGAGLAATLACATGGPAKKGPEGRGRTAPMGSFAVAFRTLGDRMLEPTECAAGDRQSFLGVDLSTPESPLVIRLVVDPLEGPAVRLYSAEAMFDRSVAFRRSDFRTLHFSLESTGWCINDDEDYRLTLELDCDREGELIQGTASSPHCH
jgi:hypothetical protein